MTVQQAAAEGAWKAIERGGEKVIQMTPAALEKLTTFQFWKAIRDVSTHQGDEYIKRIAVKGEKQAAGFFTALWETIKFSFQRLGYHLTGLKDLSAKTVERLVGGSSSGGVSRTFGEIRTFTQKTTKEVAEASTAHGNAKSSLQSIVTELRKLDDDIIRLTKEGKSSELADAKRARDILINGENGQPGKLKLAMDMYSDKSKELYKSRLKAAAEELDQALLANQADSPVATTYRRYIQSGQSPAQARQSALALHTQPVNAEHRFLDEALVPSNIADAYSKAADEVQTGLRQFAAKLNEEVPTGQKPVEELMKDLIRAVQAGTKSEDILKANPGATPELLKVAETLGKIKGEFSKLTDAQVKTLISGSPETAALQTALGRNKDKVAQEIKATLGSDLGATTTNATTIQTAMARLQGMLDRKQLVHIPDFVPVTP
jgi:hypothetical protein